MWEEGATILIEILNCELTRSITHKAISPVGSTGESTRFTHDMGLERGLWSSENALWDRNRHAANSGDRQRW